MKCSNCGAAMSCGCQKRTTADGRSGCTKCISGLQRIKPSSKPEPFNLETKKK
jgi:hypothetical protein